MTSWWADWYQSHLAKLLVSFLNLVLKLHFVYDKVTFTLCFVPISKHQTKMVNMVSIVTVYIAACYCK